MGGPYTFKATFHEVSHGFCHVGCLVDQRKTTWVGYRPYTSLTNFEIHVIIFVRCATQPMATFDVTHVWTQDVFESFLPSFVDRKELQQIDNHDQFLNKCMTPHDVEGIAHKEKEAF